MNAKQQRFVETLAKFLVSDEGRKSIELQLGTPYGKSWAELRHSTSLFGYYNDDGGFIRAVEELTDFLYPENG